MSISAASPGEHRPGQPADANALSPAVLRVEPTPPGSSEGLKYFRIQFSYAGATKYLRLTGWSEASALAEFRRHFPEAAPERIEFLGIV